MIDTHTHPFGPPSYATLGPYIKSVPDVVGFRTRHPELYRARLTEPFRDFVEDLVAEMDARGIRRALIQASPGSMSNELVAAAAAKFPDRLVGLFGIGKEQAAAGYPEDPEAVRRRAPAQIADCVERLKLRGCGELNVRSFTREIHPEKIASDLEPIMRALAACEAPVQIPTGWSQFAGALYLADPVFVDEIAARHPRVSIILTKMGRGITHYFESALAVAMRNANVYFDTVSTTGAHLRRAIDTIGADRIMFGSDWSPTWQWVRVPSDLYTLRFKTLEDAGLSHDEREQILWRTASLLFRLDSS